MNAITDMGSLKGLLLGLVFQTLKELGAAGGGIFEILGSDLQSPSDRNVIDLVALRQGIRIQGVTRNLG